MSKKQPTDADRLKSEIVRICQEKAKMNRGEFVIIETYPGVTPEQEAECYRQHTITVDLCDAKEPSIASANKEK